MEWRDDKEVFYVCFEGIGRLECKFFYDNIKVFKKN